MAEKSTAQTTSSSSSHTAEGSGQQAVKRRAACDECRTKKLKCTGEQPACSRCERENIICVYSPQKQMGRPKKRQRTEENLDGSSTNKPVQSTQQQQLWEPSMNETAGTGLDMSSWYTPFSPWLQSSNTAEWDFNLPDGGSVPAENAIPRLTPDSSSNSPPMLNLPPELQNTHSHHHPNSDPSTQLLLDPSLATTTTATGTSNLGIPSALLPSCACLSTLYLTLNNLSSMDPTFPFPFALHPLREAMSTAAEVIRCPECPTRFISAIQNTQLLGTLLVSISERFSKILLSITTEAERADREGESKKFRLADLNTSTLHLHTGGIGCAAAFSINMSPSEWRSMSKKVVRAEVYGPSEGNHCCAHFLGLVQAMEDRQARWHCSAELPEDFPTDSKTGKALGGRNMPKEEHLCLKMVNYARKLVEGFDWS